MYDSEQCSIAVAGENANHNDRRDNDIGPKDYGLNLTMVFTPRNPNDDVDDYNDYSTITMLKLHEIKC